MSEGASERVISRLARAPARSDPCVGVRGRARVVRLRGVLVRQSYLEGLVAVGGGMSGVCVVGGSWAAPGVIAGSGEREKRRRRRDGVVILRRVLRYEVWR